MNSIKKTSLSSMKRNQKNTRFVHTIGVFAEVINNDEVEKEKQKYVFFFFFF